jgi:hypothetical protein
MKFAQIFVIAMLLAIGDNSVSAIRTKDFNGADEDEIMDKVFSKYSVEGKDHNGVKNGQKILMKQTAPKAAGVILEATHKLKGSQVPGYMKANFEKAWNRFDINADGFIRAEETHTFMRSLMGKLNKFALAPGSLSDIGGGPVAATQSLAEGDDTPKPKKVIKKAKKAAPAPKADDADADATPAPDADADAANVEVDVSSLI